MPKRRQTNPRQPQRWQPSEGDSYYLMLGNGMIELFPWSDTAFDHEAWYFGNCFKTHKEAVQAREQITEVFRNFHTAQG